MREPLPEYTVPPGFDEVAKKLAKTLGLGKDASRSFHTGLQSAVRRALQQSWISDRRLPEVENILEGEMLLARVQRIARLSDQLATELEQLKEPVAIAGRGLLDELRFRLDNAIDSETSLGRYRLARPFHMLLPGLGSVAVMARGLCALFEAASRIECSLKVKKRRKGRPTLSNFDQLSRDVAETLRSAGVSDDVSIDGDGLKTGQLVVVVCAIAVFLRSEELPGDGSGEAIANRLGKGFYKRR